MSVNWLAKAWQTQTGSPTRKAVLIALADRCGEEGTCWPSYRDLMDRTELGRTTVQESITDLVVDGLIEHWDRSRPDGSNTSKGYRLLIPDISSTPSGSRTGGSGSRTGPRPPDGRRTEPSVEPSSVRTMRRRGATSQQDTEPGEDMQPREGDDSTSTEESPGFGKTPRKTNDEVKQVARTRGVSGFGLALRLQKRLDGQPGSLAIVDVRALAKRLNDAHRAGTSRETQAAMIELFASNPRRYRSGDHKGWTSFLAAVPKLEADAAKSAGYDLDDDIDPYARHA